MSKLPEFIVIGAAKCGTTSLCDDLARHRGAFVSTPKEPEFFCRDEKYELGIDWYRSLFAGRQDGQIAGEGSTMYTNRDQFPLTVERMAAVVPDVRLVYMMREPVARAYSHWIQEQKTDANLRRDSDIPRVFEDALESRCQYISCGDYKLQMKPYLEAFGRERLHLIVFEEYVNDRPRVLLELCGFLGLDAEELVGLGPVWSNKTDRFYSSKTRVELARRLNAIPGVRLPKRLLPPGMRRSILRTAVQTPIGRSFVDRRKPAPMRPETRQLLSERYAPVVRWVEDFLGRRLDCWRA